MHGSLARRQFGRRTRVQDLLTKSHLDKRLLQMIAAITAVFVVVALLLR